MGYVGIQRQQSRNNNQTIILLCLFPVLVLALVFGFCCVYYWFIIGQSQYEVETQPMPLIIDLFIQIAPIALGGVFLWFVIAYFANASMIRSATSAHSLERKENKRVYNLVENLCMSQGMKMPKVNVIEDDSLNAFASGINDNSYTVTLSRGIINKLNDEELEGVIAHELTHIINKDVRLLIVSIVFVGIFAMVGQIALRIALGSGRVRSRNSKDNGGMIIILLAVAILAAVGFLFSSLMRFAISRKREYVADAGAAQMTKNPRALSTALRKISDDPYIEAVTREDVAQLFIEHPGKKVKGFFSAFNGMFDTHPSIKSRIRMLEEY